MGTLHSPQSVLLEIGRAGYLESARIAPTTFKRMKEQQLLQSWGGHVILTRRGIHALQSRRFNKRGGKR
jgi:hypothetical protein